MSGADSQSLLAGPLLDRLTHHVHILAMNGDSYRLKHSKQKRAAERANTVPSGLEWSPFFPPRWFPFAPPLTRGPSRKTWPSGMEIRVRTFGAPKERTSWPDWIGRGEDRKPFFDLICATPH